MAYLLANPEAQAPHLTGFLNQMPNPENYITSNADLSEVVEMINQEKLVALDTEFMREKTYYPILSLIQIAVRKSGEQKLFIVDALSGLDLKPLIAIIFDKKITKILHASLQDLQIFYQKSDIPHLGMLDEVVESVIDTQIMANFCGFDFNSGYSSLVEKLLNKDLDKSLQRSDWQRRPLSSQQLEYALLDVIFLEEIHQKLYQILQQKNRKDWYLEELKSFISKTMIESKDSLFRSFSFKGRSRDQVIKIKNLALWREEQAKKFDVPRQHFMRDHVIERIVLSGEIAANLSAQQISEIKKILEQKEQILEKSSEKFLGKEEGYFMTDKQKLIYKEAKDLIAKIACEENIKEQFLITSQNLKNLVCSKKPIAQSLSGWRYQLCGQPLEQIINK